MTLYLPSTYLRQKRLSQPCGNASIDLTTNCVIQTKIFFTFEVFFRCLDKVFPDMLLFIKLTEFITMLLANSATWRTQINQPIAMFNKISTFDWKLQFPHVYLAKACEFSHLLFSKKFCNAFSGNQLTIMIGHRTVFREDIIIFVNDVITQLFRCL